MPRALKFLFGDTEYALEMTKVDRSRLYGSKEIEVLDENDYPCELATLADDGCTMIGRGGTGMGWLDADGRWRDKSELRPHNVDGDPIEPVASSFRSAIKLFDTATADEYLSHNIRLAYQLQSPSAADCDRSDKGENGDDSRPPADSSIPEDLNRKLARGTIFKFEYSYRGGLEADIAFLLHNDSGDPMMVVGNPSLASFVGIQSSVLEPDPEDVTDDEPDALMDFDMI